MAEIGHSTLKKKKPLALVDAAWEDVCTAIMQEQEHTAFLEGRARSSGRGPTATKLGERAKRDQMMRSKEYQQAFREGRTSIVEGGNFIPSKRAKHRPDEQIGDDVQGRDVPPQQTGSGQGNGNTPRKPLAPINIFNRENPPLLCFLAGPLADPGFGQGGGPRNFVGDFANIVKKSGKRSEPILAGVQGLP